ncbi:B-block binding subunit of TFIIIC [Penicillium paradoxum]|uniref:B-block binding subunit of TFIIIC n=1 Tax=Penicillium paradoxum TaxID=176176 RepID=UPI002548159D|nr:B-block binding subunit of TFIIIC [Penicillium paradoxum]KAJ5782526.1 B-block binding subunit of TFIIIC [Penicillium paradoxum]
MTLPGVSSGFDPGLYAGGTACRSIYFSPDWRIRSQGATLSDVLKAIDDFHLQTQEGARQNQNIDRLFQAKVWSWLTTNPEVSVGQNNEWNHLTLDEAEQIDSQATKSSKATSVPESDETVQQNPDPSPIRIFVSEERIWLAITGHPPDETKVLPLEFVLLSVIASRKSEGIVQPELVKLSGQDKRSVPKRTAALHQKGYIDKRPVQTKKARTSLCTLQRYFRPTASQAVAQSKDESESKTMIDFDTFNTNLFDILREHPLIARSDLKTLLGFDDPWRWKVLSRALRKWERIGVVQRVRAESQYERMHPCVKLLRDPTQQDLDLFHEFNFDVLTKHGVGARFPLNRDVDLEGPSKRSLSPEEDGLNLIKEHVEHAGRIVPSWTPDRILYNQIFDIVEKSGTTGITNQTLNWTCFGSFYKRPAEGMVHRLVDLWQVAQPLHLRHLAIVRDMAMKKTVMYYVHYSVNNFAKVVEAGRAVWEAVEFPAKKAKALKLDAPPFGVLPQLDELGFPKKDFPRGMLKNANSTLLDGINAAKPSDYLLSSADPFVVKLADGKLGMVTLHNLEFHNIFSYNSNTIAVVRTRTDKLPPGSKQLFEGRARNPGRTGLPKGRPSRAMLEKRARESEATEAQVAPSEPESEPDVPQAYGWEDVVETPPTKRARTKHKLIGLSKKEKFEALGMDENWTEYNALIMDKPVPGLYVTPRGRRRPVGKSRGRPRQSRIAVFKLPKLASLPWFVKDKDDSSDDDATRNAGTTIRDSESVVPEPTPSIIKTEGRFITPTPTPSRRFKRTLPDQITLGSPTPSLTSNTTDFRNEGPNKRSRLNKDQDANEEGPLDVADEITIEDATRGPQEGFIEPITPRHRDKSASIHQLEDEENETPSKRRRVASSDCTTQQSPAPRPSDVPTPRSSLVVLQQTQSTSDVKPAKPRRRARGIRSALGSNEEGFESIRPLIERGGSISVLRKKYLMEIIEKAGGVYPAGTAIWYPFVTAWMKAHPKEKPDLRTVNNACRQLVDAGLLRQLTFSGKDKKNVMVTKKLLLKPDIPADSPLVKEMQTKVLAIDIHDNQPYFADNVELNPNLTRSGGRPHSIRTRFALPVEQETHVHLQQKPAFVVNYETRQGRLAHTNIVRRLAAQAKAAKVATDNLPDVPGVQRLMTLARPPELDIDAHPHTSIIRPLFSTNMGGPVKYRKRAVHAKRAMMKPISAIGAYAMLMNPAQQFHSTTGTFTTGSCWFKPPKPKHGAAKQPVMDIREIESSVNELSRLAHDDKDLLRLSRMKQFDLRTKKILDWELDHHDLFAVNLKGQQFIEQTIRHEFETAPVQGEIRFEVSTGPLERASLGPPMPTRRSEALRLRKSVPEIPDTTIPKTPKTRRKRASRAAPKDRRLAKLDDTAPSDKEAQKPKRIRRYRVVRPISEELKKKLMIALVVVRVLAGGAESRIIDWTLVTKGFPNQDPSFIEGRARQILSKNRLQITKMHRDFQECFLEGYKRDEVPRIDYSDLAGYDWPALIEWACTKLDISSSERVPDLPATREQFDNLFELREDPITAGDELYQSVHGVTLNHKRHLMARNPCAVTLVDEAHPRVAPRKVYMAQLEAAKTWVRANIITAQETYRPNEASDILSLFGDQLITRATQALIDERVISSTSRGRITPGRNYDISENFLQTLSRKRAVESTQLRRAAHFKSTILDPKLRANGVYDIAYAAEDGDILALMNLYASKAIQLRPRDPPRAKFGLTDGGYETRQMDKRRFRFAIEVIPTKKYRHGNPVTDRAAAVAIPPAPSPSPSQTGVPIRTPMWYDINGQFVRRLWELVVGPVIGCLVTRPGIKASSVSSMIKPTMGVWETVLMLEWLEQAGVVKADGKGETACWRLQESWWMILS